jgi:transposase
MQPNSNKTRKSLTLIDIGNARVHTVRAIQKKLGVARLKRTPQPPYSPDVAQFDFFFSVG